ncbi:MAG: hypothetical protein B7Z66_07650 [Chromatiales bacterium 21-64-14]|nr:MAG: hypothetical protein B7Z66_07650 [Chromatiales bacterium 21-64-14]HQU15929.1 ATP-binding protein [Gammaproteobacteria bacterium]
MRSIRSRLLFALLAALTLALLAGAYATYRVARSEADERFDSQLRQLAISLRDGDFRGAPNIDTDDEREDTDIVVQVFTVDGRRLYSSAPASALAPPPRMGYSSIRSGAATWRVYATTNRGHVIEVAQSLDEREETAAHAALRVVSPFFVLLPVMGLLVWGLVGRGLAPLAGLADSVGRRDAGDLHPLGEDGVPLEALPLVRALNGLLARLGAALGAQRAFVADAAHELRTPLAAITLQAQLAGRAPGARERAAALADLDAGLRRAKRVVEQLLTLARSEPGETGHPFQPVALAALVRSVAARHLALAESKGVDLGVAAEQPGVRVSGDAPALDTLLSNLIENAVRYTPPGGQVDLASGAGPEGPWLTVSDTGPGIPTADRARVFERFYRSRDAAGPGAGLGLAIVRAVAGRHGAEVRLEDAPAGGLTVRVVWSGRPPPPAAE